MAGIVSYNISVAAAHELQPVCEEHLSEIAESEDVPLGVLYAVGLTETGRKGKLHPYALNIEGASFVFDTKRQTMQKFNEARAQGKRLIDLGCMQVNHHYHGRNFASPEEMLDPRKNITYAARYLQQLHTRERSWTMAVALYHASPRNKAAQKRYICSVIHNLVSVGFGAWTPESRKFCRVR
jgi:Transglycosylase SLT domain